MVFGPFIGAGLGALTGIGIGSTVFSGDRPKDYTFLTEAADKNDNIRTPAVANVTDEMRNIIPLTPEWTYWPDYERWVMINRLIRLMWPKLTRAILVEVVKAIKPIVQKTLNGMPSILGVVEDITLGPHSLMDAEHLDPHITEKYFTLGDHPIRVGGMKVYRTTEESCILEMPYIWGSSMAVDIQVYMKLGPLRFVLPISISQVQFKMNTRIVLNMVDTFPCIGCATVSVLGIPHIDFRMNLFNGPDVMALPGIKEVTRWVIGYVLKQVAIYPNSISAPLMQNYGEPPEPQGMVHIFLEKIEGLKSTDLMTKGDPYVLLEVREGRQQHSKTVKSSNNPKFNEEFFLVVDDLEKQKLSIKVYDYDRMSPTDDLLGTAEVFFTDERIDKDEDTMGEKVVYEPYDWIRVPLTEKKMTIPLQPAGSNLLKSIGKAAFGVAKGAASEVKNLITMTAPEVTGKKLTTIHVAKPAKEVRELKEKQAAEQKAADKTKAAAKAPAPAATTAAAAGTSAAATGGNAASAAATSSNDKAAAATAVAAADEWTEEDEKAFWAECKRISQEQKAAAATEAKRRKALTPEQRAAEDAAKKVKGEQGKTADNELVLVDEQVELRGNGNGVPKGTKPVGQLHITVRYMPFDKPTFDDDVELTPIKTGLAAYIPYGPPPAREVLTNINDFQKGLLTVTIFRAGGLTTPGTLSPPDPYVEMTLVDCDRKRPSETQKSTVKYNDGSPRWLETFDFVMISAGSMLTINVQNKVTILDAVASLKLSKSRFQDSLLGRVQIPVSDVARNGRLRDTWALQDAESGVLEMKLVWQNCYVDQYLD